MARPQPYRAAKIANRAMTITTRLRKSSSPSRWLMGLPPTSPRFKFVHTHPGSAGNSPAIPRRPPRQPPSPSARSRSLELLDQQVQERKAPSIIPAIVQRPPLPRPRSRSLDGLLDEDTKSSGGESSGEQDKAQNSRGRSMTNSEDGKIVPASEENQKQPDSKVVKNPKSSKNLEPRPMPRTKPRMSDIVEVKSETEDARASMDKDEGNKEMPPTRPPKPSRCSSLEGQSSTSFSKQCGDQERQVDEQETRETAQKRLMTQDENNDYDDDNDRSTMMLKASRSCGAGLDSDGSVSSSEYGGPRTRAKDPGSLLSLPTGAEPKRKRNFMDKCVNKVRSFMKK